MLAMLENVRKKRETCRESETFKEYSAEINPKLDFPITEYIKELVCPAAGTAIDHADDESDHWKKLRQRPTNTNEADANSGGQTSPKLVATNRQNHKLSSPQQESAAMHGVSSSRKRGAEAGNDNRTVIECEELMKYFEGRQPAVENKAVFGLIEKYIRDGMKIGMFSRTNAESSINSRVVAFLESKLDPRMLSQKFTRNQLDMAQCMVDIHKIAGPFSAAAELGENISETAQALSLLGLVFEHGIFGVTRHSQRAFIFYRYGAIHKSPEATYNLARCFENGLGTEADPEKACYFYRVAYKLGHLKALHKYARILLKGNYFISKDIPLGIHLMHIAVNIADREFPTPFYDMGMIYLTSNVHTIVDAGYAMRIFKKGASLGCGNCQFKLAEEYESGRRVPQDLRKAFVWCKAAANGGHPDAQYKLALIYSRLIMIRDRGLQQRPRCVWSREQVCGVDINDASGSAKIFGEASKEIHQEIREGTCSRAFLDNGCHDIFSIPSYENEIGPEEAFFGTTTPEQEAISLAAESRTKGASLFLGDVYENGLLGDQNGLLALWYYRIALALGATSAKDKIKSLEKRMKLHKGLFSWLKSRFAGSFSRIIKST